MIIANQIRLYHRYPEVQGYLRELSAPLMQDVGEGKFEGGSSNKKYRAIAGTTQLTASRHIKELAVIVWNG